MAKTPGLGSGRIPGQVPNLNQKEQVKAQKQNAEKLGGNDAARLAQQAGFHRYNKTQRRAFDAGDYSSAPIPLTEDEVDAEVWSDEGLKNAQENLSASTAKLAEVSKEAAAGDIDNMAEALVSSSFLPTQGGVQQMEDFLQRPAPEPIPLEEVSVSVNRHFGVDFGESTPVGHKLMATSMLVSGNIDAIEKEAESESLNEQKLTSGAQKVTEKGNGAVREAHEMSSGVSREIAMKRTFMFRR